TEFVPDAHDVGIRFLVTAYGTASQAQTIFTDGNLTSSVVVAITPPSPVAAGATLNWNIVANCVDGGGGNTCSSGGYVNGGAVQNGYSIDIQQATNATFTAGLTTRDSSTTTGGAASGSFTAPSTGGPFFYRARHSNQNLADVPVQGNNPNSWQPQNSNTVQVALSAATATLKVVKHVVNDNGGTATASAWTMNVTATAPSNSSFPGQESPGTSITIGAGSFSVTESGGPASGYVQTNAVGCSGTAVAGSTYTCTITNDDVAPKLHLRKVVTNDNGG